MQKGSRIVVFVTIIISLLRGYPALDRPKSNKNRFLLVVNPIFLFPIMIINRSNPSWLHLVWPLLSLVACPFKAQGREIVLKGFASSVVSNENSVDNIKSEIVKLEIMIKTPNMHLMKFHNPRFTLPNLDGKVDRIPGKNEDLYFECRAETSDEMVEEKELLLMAYVKLRLNGMSAFNANRVISGMANLGERIRPEDTVQIPIHLLQRVQKIPDWITVHYVNYNSDLNDLTKTIHIYILLDKDINWLFRDVEGRALCICGFDGRHSNTNGFQAVFEDFVSRRELVGLLGKNDSEEISDDIWKKFHVRWLHPLEIPLVFD